MRARKNEYERAGSSHATLASELTQREEQVATCGISVLAQMAGSARVESGQDGVAYLQGALVPCRKRIDDAGALVAQDAGKGTGQMPLPNGDVGVADTYGLVADDDLLWPELRWINDNVLQLKWLVNTRCNQGFACDDGGHFRINGEVIVETSWWSR